MIIYVVMGESGWDDDTRTWIVRAYRARHLAERAIARLDRRVIRLARLERAAYRRPERHDHTVPIADRGHLETKYLTWMSKIKPDTWDVHRNWGSPPPSYVIVEVELI